MRRRTMKRMLTVALALSLLNGTAVVAQPNNPNRNDQGDQRDRDNRADQNRRGQNRGEQDRGRGDRNEARPGQNAPGLQSGAQAGPPARGTVAPPPASGNQPFRTRTPSTARNVQEQNRG